MIMTNSQNNPLVFFGNKENSFEKIKTDFPDLEFNKLKQVHSNIIVEACSSSTEADSHFSSKVKTALLISTADCMPIMIYCRQTHRIAAVHAGWRGVENKITEKTLNRLIMTGSSNKDFKFWIGPHILQNSFEVTSETFSLLAKSQYDLNYEDYATVKNDKYFVALNVMVESQIKHVLNTTPEIVYFNIDTRSSDNYYSYRRNPTLTERNLSFICLLS